MSYSWNTTAQQAAEQLSAQIKGKTGMLVSVLPRRPEPYPYRISHLVLVTGVSPKAVGTETVRVLAPYAKTIIVASRSKQRSVHQGAAAMERADSHLEWMKHSSLSARSLLL